MNALTAREFATKVHQRSFAVLDGTIPAAGGDHHEAMKVGNTEVCLCELVGRKAAKTAFDLAKTRGGTVKIAPCRNNRVIVCVSCNDTYTLIYDDEAVAGAPSLAIFRPKPPETTLEIYKAPYSKRSDGRFRTH